MEIGNDPLLLTNNHEDVGCQQCFSSSFFVALGNSNFLRWRSKESISNRLYN